LDRIPLTSGYSGEFHTLRQIPCPFKVVALGLFCAYSLSPAPKRRAETPEVEEIMAKRTTHRSSSGKKLYAVRDKKGQFKDIQTYKRAHGQDIKRKSSKEK
jgi:hypothetical protein